MSKYSLSEEDKALYTIHFAKFLVQYHASLGYSMILSEAIKIANSRMMGWSKKPSVFKYMLTLKDYQTLDHSNLIEKARRLKEVKAIEKLKNEKRKRKDNIQGRR